MLNKNAKVSGMVYFIILTTVCCTNSAKIRPTQSNLVKLGLELSLAIFKDIVKTKKSTNICSKIIFTFFLMLQHSFIVTWFICVFDLVCLSSISQKKSCLENTVIYEYPGTRPGQYLSCQLCMALVT